MFTLFAALISSSVGFAQPKIPLAAGFAGCIQKPKTFTITDENSSFKKVSFTTIVDELGKTVQVMKIESASPNEPLIIRCDFFSKQQTQDHAPQWRIEQLDNSPSLAEVLQDFVDKEPTGDENRMGVFEITNKNEHIVHSKVIVRPAGDIELHDDSWPENKSVHLSCGHDSALKAESTRLEVYDGKTLKARYETIKFPNIPDDPKNPPAKGPCPTEDYTVSVHREDLLRISSSTESKAAPAKSKKTSGTK